MRRPRPLGAAWPEVARRLASAPQVALFSDFDGTLAPIVRHPGRARLPAATRMALRRLARHGRLVLVMVSGRSLADLRRRVGLKGIYYVGTHGVEWADCKGRRHLETSAASAAVAQKVSRALAARLHDLPGIYVERKTVSVAVHYRNAAKSTAAQARRIVRAAARRSHGRLRVLEGRKVIELLPPGQASKGRAVLALAERLRNTRRPLVIYLGDDVTDESVFRRLRAGDIGIHVGGNTASRARFRLRSPAAVKKFLQRLGRVVE